jgi:hypothetical protein
MTQFIESLARLYKMQKISQKTIDTLLTAKKITQIEYEYIITAGEE